LNLDFLKCFRQTSRLQNVIFGAAPAATPPTPTPTHPAVFSKARVVRRARVWCCIGGQVGNTFVVPDTQQMTFAAFLEKQRTSPFVHYISHQNSSLTDELPELVADVEESMGWADEVFGGPPDAANFWCGPKEAVTSVGPPFSLSHVLPEHSCTTLH
jgi:hypothetical protein